MDFVQISYERALEFHAHVVAREPYRLRDLAVRMRDTGGPVEQMDASVASLVPLWEWFVGFVLADCPGVPVDAVPSRWESPEEGSPAQRSRRPAEVAAEGIEHYLRLVLERWHGSAPWVVYAPAGVKDFHHNETAVALPRGHLWVGIVTRMTRGIPENRDGRRDPMTLHDVFLRNIGRPIVPVQEPGPSVLTPYLHSELPPMPPAAATSPVPRWWAEDKATPPPPPTRPTGNAGEEMVLLRGPAAGLDDRPDLLQPFPTQPLAQGLTRAGFTSDNHDHVLPEHLLIDDAHFHHVHGFAVISTYVHHGTVRALLLEPLGATTAQWNRLENDLHELATTLGARFRPHTDLDDD